MIRDVVVMANKEQNRQNQKQFISLENLVSQDDVIRKLDSALDFSFVYDEVDQYYGEQEQPGVDPIQLVKYLLFIHLYDIKAITHTSLDEQLQPNILCHWFLRVNLNEQVPRQMDVVHEEQTHGGFEVWDSLVKHVLRRYRDCGLPHERGAAWDS